ncbi:hypothetical protein [Prescottella agglutinans]|uniref:Energy-coupling factor transporter transmembrane protein EcfT n=1 Tax=Prescottella agglutinans TaxID=1644129 RepID=A0ABT6MHZ1_9NOCA|nr:hypothetical protein [Prescottella agglutinans]MDH6283938.1 energy-coupling factor transporter transmembrane protein EcfT [Prescottella agglutinans]
MTEDQRRQRRRCSVKAVVLTLSWLVCIAVIVFVPGWFALLVGLEFTVAAAITGFIGVCVLAAGLLVSLR